MENVIQDQGGCQRMCSGSITKLAKAMLEVQKVVAPAYKDKYNGFTQSKYATLNSVMEACSEALINQGIWVTQYPVPVEGNSGSFLGLVTKLVHAESGEWQSSLLVMPLPKNDPQGYGSALTYARRYGLSSLVGIVTDDDDANSACFEFNSPPRISTREALNKPSLEEEIQYFTGVNLPKVDGITFQEKKGKDGFLYIIANGNTRNKTGVLKEAGFTWNTRKKMWIKKVHMAA